MQLSLMICASGNVLIKIGLVLSAGATHLLTVLHELYQDHHPVFVNFCNFIQDTHARHVFEKIHAEVDEMDNLQVAVPVGRKVPPALQ